MNIKESETENAADGPLGRIAGRAKELAGSVLGREDLNREGRLQQVEAEAERSADRIDPEAGG